MLTGFERPNITSPAEKIKRRNSFHLIANLLGSKHFVGDGPENFLIYEKFVPSLRKKPLKNHFQKIKFMKELTANLAWDFVLQDCTGRMMLLHLSSPLVPPMRSVGSSP